MKSDYISSLPAEVRDRISALKNVHVTMLMLFVIDDWSFKDKDIELERKYRDEVLVLQKKYLALHQPLYEKVIFVVPKGNLTDR